MILAAVGTGTVLGFVAGAYVALSYKGKRCECGWCRYRRGEMG